MIRTYDALKDSLTTHVLPEFSVYDRSYGGIVDSEEARNLENYDQTAIHQRKILENLLNRITNPQDGEEDTLYDDMSTLLTTVSLDLTPNSKPVLIFVPNSNSERRLAATLHRLEDDKPDLVAFFTERKIAQLIASQGSYEIDIPSKQLLVCAVELKARASQSRRYMSTIARHNPSSSVVHGLFANRELFQLFSLGLDHRTEWSQVKWEDDGSIDKLYTCIKIILDNALREVPTIFPNIISDSPVSVKDYKIYLYRTTINQSSFALLPLYHGRGHGRKPFVAIAVPNDGEKGRQSIVRIFKYSWYKSMQHDRERCMLMKLRGVPGVVQIDETLSRNSIGMDEWSGRVRSLLALKTIGYPLCSCTTVLEFLEAMYDLLEVLRYLVQEKDILHRDISWGNVLIRPEHSPDVKIDFRPRATNEPIPHRYRFISDIFRERRRVRVALVDFDLASHLNDASEAELKESTGTPMFMANDVLLVDEGYPTGFDSVRVEYLRTSVADSTLKYSNDSERAAWDTFYSNLTRIEPVHPFPAARFFKHGAVHDAESVFCLCLLFFNRMRRSSMNDDSSTKEEILWGDAFNAIASKSSRIRLSAPLLREVLETGFDAVSVELLRPINEYLAAPFPWFNAKSTGHKERYEFHLHDFMQRLLLRKIREMRQDEADPIAILDKPRRVRVGGLGDAPYKSHSRGLASFIDERERATGQNIARQLPTLTGPSEDTVAAQATGISDHRVGFKESHFVLLKYKERERLWTIADNLF